MSDRNKIAKGRRGEELAARFLTGLGYEIIERNFRGEGKELDLIAKDGKELVFVEVKAGSSKTFGAPELRVHARKQQNVSTAALSYLSSHPQELDGCRFDVVAVELPSERIKHYKSAFVLTTEF